MSNGKRGVIYARYSAGPHQTEQSIEGQVRECKRYAQQNGITIVGEYIDRKISGTTDNREQFLRMIADSRKHLFDVVITYKTDRFSRNRYDAAVYKRQLRLNGVEIAYSSESIPDGPEGIILESLLEGLAEYYSAELRQKIERGMHESALKCKAMGRMPLGYRKGADGRYEINPDEAEIIKVIFDKYVQGGRLTDIANDAYAMGLRTRYGKPVSKARIAEMLDNKKYIGVYSNRGVVIEGGMPAIIDEETFYRAQKRKEYARHYVGRQTSGIHGEFFPLSGKTFCAVCGEPYVGYSGTSSRGDLIYYYICRGRKKKICDVRYIKKEVLEKVVARETVQRVLQPDVLSRIMDAYLKLDEQSQETEQKKRLIQSSLTRTKNEIDNVVSAIASGMNHPSLRDKLTSLEAEKTRLSIELSEYSNRPKMTQQQLKFLFQSVLKEEGEKEEAYRFRLLNTFVKSVLVYRDKIVVTYNLQDSNCEPVYSVKECNEFVPSLGTKLFFGCAETVNFSPSNRLKWEHFGRFFSLVSF